MATGTVGWLARRQCGSSERRMARSGGAFVRFPRKLDRHWLAPCFGSALILLSLDGGSRWHGLAAIALPVVFSSSLLLFLILRRDGTPRSGEGHQVVILGSRGVPITEA